MNSEDSSNTQVGSQYEVGNKAPQLEVTAANFPWKHINSSPMKCGSFPLASSFNRLIRYRGMRRTASGCQDEVARHDAF